MRAGRNGLRPIDQTLTQSVASVCLSSQATARYCCSLGADMPKRLIKPLDRMQAPHHHGLSIASLITRTSRIINY